MTTLSRVALENERAIAALNASRTPAAVFSRVNAPSAPRKRKISQDAPAALHLILGPMFAGKTTELQRRMRRYAIAGKRTLLVTHAADTRYAPSGAVVTHDRTSATALSVTRLKDVPRERWTEADVIGIDEAQFFDDLNDFVTDALANGKIIEVASLNGTFKQEAFGQTLSLVPAANSLVLLTAICVKCGDDASFTRRIDKTDAETVSIGGSETYEAVCRAHLT